MRCHVLS